MDDVEKYTDLNLRAVALLDDVQSHTVFPWHMLFHTKLNEFSTSVTALRGELAELDSTVLGKYKLPTTMTDAGLPSRQLTILSAVRNTAMQTIGEVSGSISSHKNSINFGRSFLISLVALYYAIK